MICTLLLGLVAVPGSDRAEGVPVHVELAESEIFLGESVALTVRIEGVRQVTPPDVRHPDMSVSFEGGQTFSDVTYTIVNGQTRQVETFGYTARYILRPQRAGVLSIPALAVEHDGRIYHGNPLQLVVRRSTEQEYLLVKVYTDKPSYVLGETVTVTLDLSLRKLAVNGAVQDIDPFFPNRPPELQIPWFEGIEDWRTDDLDAFVRPLLGRRRAGFYINDYTEAAALQPDRLRFTLPRQSSRRTTGSGTWDYFTYRLQKRFRPMRSGVQSVPAVFVEAVLPVEIDAEGRAQRTEQVVAGSPSLHVDIRPLPEAGRPDSFSGAIGRFRPEVNVSPTVLKVGDPFTLSMVLHQEGDGLLETIQPPRLHERPDLTRDFKVHPDPHEVSTLERAKRFAYTLRPRHAAVRAVPPLEVAYYDTEAGRYQAAWSEPVPLQVEAANTFQVSDVIAAPGNRATNVIGPRLSDGLLATYVGAEMLTPQPARIRMTPLLGALLVFPPLAFMAAVLTRQWRTRTPRDDTRRRRKAGARAVGELQDLMKRRRSLSEADFCAAVQRILRGYFSDRWRLPAAGLTMDDITRRLNACEADPQLVERTAALLRLCDDVRYAPGKPATDRVGGLPEEAERLIRSLEAGLPS